MEIRVKLCHGSVRVDPSLKDTKTACLHLALQLHSEHKLKFVARDYHLEVLKPDFVRLFLIILLYCFEGRLIMFLDSTNQLR